MSTATTPASTRFRGSIEPHYTAQEVAETLAVKPRTVRAWIEQGEIRAVKLHRQWRIPASEIHRFIRRGEHVG